LHYNQRVEDFMEMTPEELRIRPRIAFAWINTEEELIEKLSSIQVPTLIIGGGQDNIISPKAIFRSACAVPNAKTIFYQSGPHMLATEEPWAEDTKDEILLFLEQQERKLKKAG